MSRTVVLLFVALVLASILALSGNPAYAAPTRIYFSNAAEPPVSPGFDGWNETDDAVRRQLLSVKSASEAIAEGFRHNWSSTHSQLDRQYVSEPMVAGISFSSVTMKVQLACREYQTGDNSFPRMSAKIVSQDGTVTRQQLLQIANYGTGVEYRAGAFGNVQFANGDTVNGTYATVSGDRLVIEIGHQDVTALPAAIPPEGHCRFGAPSSTADYGENESQTTILVPWVEFSNTISFQTIPSQVTGLTATSVSTTQINLSWTAPSDGNSPITGYKIERESPVGGGWSVLVADTGSTSTTYSNSGLTQNTQYNYRVSAINALGTGAASDAASAVTNVDIPAGSTRFYFSGAAVPSVSPAFDGWNLVDEVVRRQLLTAKSASESLALGARHGWTAVNNQLDRQYVSEPMVAGISFSSDTIKLQLACREFNVADNSVPRMSAKIVSHDGTILRHQLLTIENYGTTTPYINDVTLRNVQFANGDALSGTYTTTAGDRLVIEIGHDDSAGTTPEAQCRFGAPTSVADHGENDSETDALVPWVEISSTITFMDGEPFQVTGLTATTASSSQINLSWTAPSAGDSPITGYKIERESPVGGGWSVLVADTGSTSTAYSNAGLNPNTQYNYRVSAINAIGTGIPSSAASAVTNVDVPAGSTRLYFGNVATPSVAPAFDGDWVQTDAVARRQLLTAKSGSEPLVLGTIHSWTSAQNQLDRQYISDPMVEGILFSSDTMKLQLACREFNVADNSVPRMSAKIVSYDGTTLRHQLLPVANYGTVATYNQTELRNVQFANGDALAGAYTTTAGDRLVIEIGHDDSAGATPQAQCRYGADNLVADHGENDSETAALVPWVEISNTLTFLSGEPSQVTGLTATAVSSSQINLSWTAPSAGDSPITGYKIERESPVGGGWSVLVADTGSTSTAYSNSGLTQNTQYNYRVSAINAIGTGIPSSAASAVTDAYVPAGSTRFYFSNAATPLVNPGFDADWTQIDAAARRQLLSAKSSSESVAAGIFHAWTSAQNQLDRQYVSEPMTSGISFSPATTVKLQLACREPADADNAVPRMSAKIVSEDGTILRQQLLSVANYGTGAEYYVNTTDFRNIKFANGTALVGTYVTVSGDRLVIEIGHDDVGGSTPRAQCLFGAPNSGSDLPEDELEIGTSVPWVEFSNTITFLASEVPVTEDTVSTTQRNPPRILGLGLYHVEFAESSHDHALDEVSHFENYYPYAMSTYLTDQEFYDPLGHHVKTGLFFEFKDGRAAALSQIHTEPGDYFQFQVQILDEYRGSQIERVGLYFVSPESAQTKSDTGIFWEKPDRVVILDQNRVIDWVHVTTSMEDGYLWAVFDVRFRDSVDYDVGLEASHESKVPVFAKVTNLLQKFAFSEFEGRKDAITHISRVVIPHAQASAPECKDTKSCYIPYNAYVLKGGVVIWTNEDEDFVHTITSGTPETGPDNRFNGLVHPGEIFHRTFGSVGVYPYYCIIHPWAEGMVTVVEEQSTITLEDLSTPGVNVAGNATVLKKSEFPLVLETDSSGKSVLIKQNDRITLDTQNLDVKISGFVGSKNPVGPVEITIKRPDGSDVKHTLHVGEDGKYYLPTKLADNWQTGTFQIIAKYGGKELGSMSFVIEDKSGLGGTLKTSADDHIFDYVQSGFVDKSHLSGIGWMSVETADPENHRIYMLTRILDGIAPQNDGSPKFEYYYLLAFTPLLALALLFRKRSK